MTGAIAIVAVLGASVGRAQAAPPCATSAAPWVSITGSVPELGALTDLLRAELASRGIDLRPATDGCDANPIAMIAVSHSEQGARIVVEVSDRLTAKRLEREVDLTTVPSDGRPWTLAVAAGELLRASWAELALAGAPRPSGPLPPEVRESLAQDLEPAPPSWPGAGLGAAAAIEHWSGGTTLYGADVRAALWLNPRLAAVVRVGLRDGTTASAPDGQVHTSAWLAGLGTTLRVTPWRRAGIDGEARFDLAGVSYVALPDPRASGFAATGVALVAAGGAQGWIDLGTSLRLAIDGLMSIPLRQVRAQDAGRDVTSISGIGVQGGLSFGVLL